jgi:hypothetical protein
MSLDNLSLCSVLVNRMGIDEIVEDILPTRCE